MRRWIERFASGLTMAIGLLLMAPSLQAGFYHDDYAYFAALDGRVPGVGPFGLYAHTAVVADLGGVQGDF